MCSSAAAASISPLSKNTQPYTEPAAARLARAISMARRAKATPSTQGRADPPLANSSLTICRPGSSTTAYPRLPSSADQVEQHLVQDGELLAHDPADAEQRLDDRGQPRKALD